MKSLLKFFVFVIIFYPQESLSEKPRFAMGLDELYSGLTKKLANAVGKGDLIKAGQLIRQGAEVNSVGEAGLPILYWPLRENSINGFEFLLKMGASPNFQWDQTGGSIMELTSKAKDERYLILSLAFGGNPNLVNNVTTETPLIVAAKFGREENILALVKAGAHVNATTKSSKISPLMAAITAKEYSTALLLIELGADVSHRDVWGLNAKARIDRVFLKPEKGEPKFYSFNKLVKLLK